MKDILAIQSKHGSFLDYYEDNNLISLSILHEHIPVNINSLKIIPLLSPSPSLQASLFVLEERGKRAIYASSHCVPFEPLLTHPLLQDSSLLIIGDILPSGPLKYGYSVPPCNRLREETMSLEDLKNIIDSLHSERTIVVHIEEEWGKSYRDYRVMEEEYAQYNIHFGYDGLKIRV
jgi:phosphoribosyl 1,2-cyclic phosphate phosphodiesterase